MKYKEVLTDSEYLIYKYIKDHADKRAMRVETRKVAKATGICISSAKNAINRLRVFGFITKVGELTHDNKGHLLIANKVSDITHTPDKIIALRRSSRNLGEKKIIELINNLNEKRA